MRYPELYQTDTDQHQLVRATRQIRLWVVDAVTRHHAMAGADHAGQREERVTMKARLRGQQKPATKQPQNTWPDSKSFRRNGDQTWIATRCPSRHNAVAPV
jgi:hypothetical protein